MIVPIDDTHRNPCHGCDIHLSGRDKLKRSSCGRKQAYFHKGKNKMVVDNKTSPALSLIPECEKCEGRWKYLNIEDDGILTNPGEHIYSINFYALKQV